MLRFPVFCLLLVLAACGSAPPDTVEQRPRAAEPAPDPRPAIVAFGDSLSAGYGLDPGQSYPDFLQRALDARGIAFRVVNAGVSGDTTSGGLARIDTVLSHKPVLVILELGGNDGLRGIPIAETRGNFQKMIERLQAGGARVLLAGITLPPNYGSEYIGAFEEMYRDLAKQYGVPLIPFLLEGVALESGMMQRDGIHPTADGNRKVAETVLRYLEPMLPRS
ncbi:MAG: arylesterase [Bryobacterales bacterium]|nr:arylesterase [Bryobacterales bacterium]